MGKTNINLKKIELERRQNEIERMIKKYPQVEPNLPMSIRNKSETMNESERIGTPQAKKPSSTEITENSSFVRDSLVLLDGSYEGLTFKKKHNLENQQYIKKIFSS